MSDATEGGPAFLATTLVGGVLFGFGLGYSHMARPEVVLDFLQLEDFGLLFVMGGAAAVTGVVFAVMSRSGRTAPLTGRRYGRRLKTMDVNVIGGGVVFGVGNLPILWALAGMFVGAYAQGVWRTRSADAADPADAAAD